MRYDIRDQLTVADGSVACEVDAPAPPGAGAEFVERVTGQVDLRNTGEHILARGWLRTTAVAECSRCLRKHHEHIEFDFCEDCSLTQIDEPISYAAELGGDESVPVPILDDRMVDLSELVRQLLIVHLPSHSVCSPDCRGLCPHCGADLNEGACDCEDDSLDPRLAPLRDLLKKL
jgi:uncharacterized protein